MMGVKSKNKIKFKRGEKTRKQYQNGGQSDQISESGGYWEEKVQVQNVQVISIRNSISQSMMMNKIKIKSLIWFDMKERTENMPTWRSQLYSQTITYALVGFNNGTLFIT